MFSLNWLNWELVKLGAFLGIAAFLVTKISFFFL